MQLDLILENVRNKYNMSLLEEGTNLSERDLLKGKMMINETTMNIRKMLITEGAVEQVKMMLQENWQQHLANNKGRYAAGAGAVAAGGLGYAADQGYLPNEFGKGWVGQAGDQISQGYDAAKNYITSDGTTGSLKSPNTDPILGKTPMYLDPSDPTKKLTEEEFKTLMNGTGAPGNKTALDYVNSGEKLY
jgi:hypothetical protein